MPSVKNRVTSCWTCDVTPVSTHFPVVNNTLSFNFSRSPAIRLLHLYATAKMSASPIARQAAQPQGQAIPRRILINDASQLPHDYSTTPNGTLFSTTPGGTKIIYDRNFLLQMRNSPVARTPPKNLPVIPGVTCDSPQKEKSKLINGQKNVTVQHKPVELPTVEIEKVEDKKQEEPQFEMDI